MKKKPTQKIAAKKAPSKFVIRLEHNDDGALNSFDDVEAAQRAVTIALLEGKLGDGEARTRTRSLEALARCMRAADTEAKR